MARDKQIQIRRDVSSDWTAINPILASGEGGLETNTGKLKFGDGSTAWNDLPYLTQGEKGDKGDRGYQGTAGLKGDPGNDGAPGATGQTGLPGSTGNTGAKGDKGDTGATGTNGTNGAKGEKGDKGDTGNTGATGSPGLTGSQGEQGIQGEQGDKGDTGDAGTNGTNGTDGADGVIQSIVGGSGITVDNTDPANPEISTSGAVTSVNGDTGDVVLNQDDVLDGTTYKQYSATEKTKLAGIETAADVTDATNVAAAGAFIKSVDDTDDITVGSTNKFATAAEKTKLGFIAVTQNVDLDAIETNANNVPGIKTKTDFITVTQAVDLDTMESDIAGKQPLDTDLTTIAALDSSVAGALVTDGAGWIKKTYAQLKTALSLVKGDVGLGNVDNTSDVNKPVSTAQQTAIDAKVADAINDGTTTIAPSQNAVFDALALKQPLDSDLTSWAAIARASGFDTFATTPSGANLASLLTSALPASKGGTGLTALSANVVSMLGAADYAAIRTLLALVIGTNVQAWDADLDTWATKTAPSGTVVGTTDAQTITNKILDSTSPTAYFFPGTIVPSARRSAPTGWLLCDGSAVSRSTYADLFAAICESVGTFTVTIATPAVVSQTAHGMVTGDQVYLTTTGALPTGLTANTLYYVIRVDANSYNLATTRANAVAGTKINTTGSQSGVHTSRWCPYGLGDGSTTFTLPDFRGRTIAGADAMGGTAASRLNLADALGSYGQVGASGGEQRHTMTTGELVSHTHGQQVGTASDNNTPFYPTIGARTQTNNLGTSGQTQSAGSTTPFNLISPTAIANYMIKT